MPLYEYECKECKDRFTKLAKRGEDPPKCPTCGKDTEQQLSSPALSFQGTGFYTTDYKDK